MEVDLIENYSVFLQYRLFVVINVSGCVSLYMFEDNNQNVSSMFHKSAQVGFQVELTYNIRADFLMGCFEEC